MGQYLKGGSCLDSNLKLEISEKLTGKYMGQYLKGRRCLDSNLKLEINEKLTGK